MLKIYIEIQFIVFWNIMPKHHLHFEDTKKKKIENDIYDNFIFPVFSLMIHFRQNWISVLIFKNIQLFIMAHFI